MTSNHAQTFNFELVSPERVLISEPASMVTIPGEEGEFGVLAGHCSLVSSIRPGTVTVERPGGKPQRIFVAGGFADVSATNCTLLAEEAVNVDDLNIAELEKNIRDLQEDMGIASTEAEKARIGHRLALAKAKLGAASA